MKRVKSNLSLLSILFLTAHAHAEWIEPPSRPWKIEGKISLPLANFSLSSADAEAKYQMPVVVLPSATFGWKFLRIGLSKQISSAKNDSSLTQFKVGLSQKFYVVDASFQKIKGLNDKTTEMSLHRSDLGYFQGGVSTTAGFSLGGDVPYSIQSYFGTVEVPKGIEIDLVVGGSLFWNSLSANAPVVPVELATAFGDQSQLKGLKSLTLSATAGAGLTIPLGQRWILSNLALAGFTFLAGSNVYVSDSNYTLNIGNLVDLKSSLIYRNENSTWYLSGFVNRRTQSIALVNFSVTETGFSLGYAFRF